jgi:gamma-glutamyltranspeptidase/glutathione hydrolase
MRNFQMPGRSTVHSCNGMAATSSPLATLEGIEVLRAGGNAVDAAVTAAAVLCITEPHMTGIGGDCFALVGTSDGDIIGLNASGRAALAADEDWLKRSSLKAIDLDSIHSVTVPGAVDGWCKLLERFGTITLADALGPAIRLAEAGVPVSPRVAADWAEDAQRLHASEGGRLLLLHDGRAPRAGEVMCYPALANSLRVLAGEGPDAFYRGQIAEDLVSYLRSKGSLLTHEDFARTQADWVEPISVEFAGHEIVELPPNGQGVTTLIALNILKQLDLKRHPADSSERMHLEVEAMRLAWVYRNRHVADSAWMDAPIKDLLSEGISRKLAALISEGRAIEEPEAAAPMPRSDTVYFCVVDSKRMAVSFINSLYHAFGSAIVTPKTGITLQNRGACFVTQPEHPNCIGPAKRPMHTLMPGMIKRRGNITHAFGVMGGAFQPMGHLLVAVNRLLYHMDMQEALDFPRYFHADGLLSVEDGVSPKAVQNLETKGHRVVRAGEALGGGQAIELDHKEVALIGASDPRKDGLALGY